MPIELPPSLDRNRNPVYDEVAHARGLTTEQRLALVAKVCRASGQLLSMHPKRDLILRMRDPLPESTKRALARLRLK